MAYVRKVRTASGAVAVQVVRKYRGQRMILAHVGSAHTDAQLGILLEAAREIAAADQGALDIEVAACTQRVDDVADWRRSRPVEWCKSGRVSACGSVVATMP